ncbi:hypothetical protein [Moorena producens]|nr:hypothetical protein [Moorena producens]
MRYTGFLNIYQFNNPYSCTINNFVPQPVNKCYRFLSIQSLRNFT